MKLIGLSTIAFFGSIECQNTAFANPVVDSIYQTNRNVRAPTYPRFNNVARIPSYKSSRFSSSGSNNNIDNSYQPSSSYQMPPSTTTTNTVKKRVRVTLYHPNCKSLPNIADVQRRVESDPVIQRKLGVQVAGVLVNKFACTDSKDKMTVDFDFYVYNDVKASDFDLLFNQNNYDDQTNNVQGFEDQVKDGSLEPTLLKAIGMYHRISPYATEKPMISLISLVSKDDAVQEMTEKMSQSLENATTQVTTLASESDNDNEIKSKDEIIEEIVNLTLNDRTLLDQIESLAEFIEGAEQNDLIDNLAEKISTALKKETLSVENISQLQKVATMAIVDYMANISSEDINNSSASEETDFAIEESGQEGVFENEVVESILDSDYSSQLDKLTREVQKSIEDREIQLEFLEDQKSFVKDLFGEEAAENKADYDLLDEDSDSTNDIEEIREDEKSSNLEGDVVELLNSLSKNENDAQENALKAILQEITTTEIESDNDENKVIVPENDLKNLLLEYRDEPEIEVSATEIVSEIMPDFFDEQNDEETETNESNVLNNNQETIKQERQEALLREIQASEEAKNEFRDAINDTFQDQFLEENNEMEDQIQSSFEVIESEEEDEEEQNDAEEEESTDFERIEDEAQIFDLDEDLEDSLTKNATINASDNTQEQSISQKQTIDINDMVNIIEENNNQNSTLSNPQNELITTNFNDNDNNSTVSVPVDLMNTSLEEPHSFADNVVETVMSIFSR